MNPPTTPPAEVVQSDREAAREWMDQAVKDGMIRRGSRNDIPLAQAFASYRIRLALGEGEKRTMCIDLTEREREALERLMAEQELSGPKVFIQALRHYQRDHQRLKDGETVTWSGDAQRARDFAGPLVPDPLAAGASEEVLDDLVHDAFCAGSDWQRGNKPGRYEDAVKPYVERARQALAALSAPSQVGEGFVVVPREPTEAMLEAATKVRIFANGALDVPMDMDEGKAAWTAMLSAAPVQAGEE